MLTELLLAATGVSKLSPIYVLPILLNFNDPLETVGPLAMLIQQVMVCLSQALLSLVLFIYSGALSPATSVVLVPDVLLWVILLVMLLMLRM